MGDICSTSLRELTASQDGGLKGCFVAGGGSGGRCLDCFILKFFAMKKNNKSFKIVVATILLGLITSSGLLAVPQYVPTFQNCPEPCELAWIMRCEPGNGNCNPSAQYFCDEVC